MNDADHAARMPEFEEGADNMSYHRLPAFTPPKELIGFGNRSMAKALIDNAAHIAKHLTLTQHEFIACEPFDAWMPPKLQIQFLRLGLIKHDQVEGGHCWTDLGKAVHAIVMEDAA